MSRKRQAIVLLTDKKNEEMNDDPVDNDVNDGLDEWPDIADDEEEPIKNDKSDKKHKADHVEKKTQPGPVFQKSQNDDHRKIAYYFRRIESSSTPVIYIDHNIYQTLVATVLSNNKSADTQLRLYRSSTWMFHWKNWFDQQQLSHPIVAISINCTGWNIDDSKHAFDGIVFSGLCQYLALYQTVRSVRLSGMTSAARIKHLLCTKRARENLKTMYLSGNDGSQFTQTLIDFLASSQFLDSSVEFLDLSGTESNYILASQLGSCVANLVKSSHTLNEIFIADIRILNPSMAQELCDAVCQSTTLLGVGNLNNCWCLTYEQMTRMSERMEKNKTVIYQLCIGSVFGDSRIDAISLCVLEYLLANTQEKITLTTEEERRNRHLTIAGFTQKLALTPLISPPTVPSLAENSFKNKI